jgi:uncharacterized protein YbjT (DUF2867 family)
MTGAGLDAALRAATSVVDVTSVGTTSGTKSAKFFGTVTRNLLAAEKRAGVTHHVALSIVGAAEINDAYYAGKRVQEDLVTASGSNWSILRATQFHEFAVQLLGSTAVGPFNLVPIGKSQPVAASEVGAALAALAVARPQGLVQDLAGPGVEDLPDMVRRYLAAVGRKRTVIQFALPGRFGKALRTGGVLPGADARLGVQTFEQWLGTL